jgi:hypothetical protein
MNAIARGLLSLAFTALLPVAAQEKPAEKQDTFDKAGKATAGGVKSAGKATEKGLSTAGKGAEKGVGAVGEGVGAGVEHTARGAVTAGEVTAGAAKKVGGAVKGLFGGSNDQGGDVERRKAAQQVLQAKGYYSGEIDGVIGPKTQSGLREFQRDEGLEATGNLNETTYEKLGVK